MARFENCELTNIFLLRRGDEILLQNRVSEDWQGYALPGGHVEPGESIVDSAVRELFEESGLTAKNPHLCGIKQFPKGERRYLVFLFIADQFEGELHSSEEGEMEWVKRSDIKNLKTVSDLEELLRVMEDPDLNEFQYVVDGDDWQVVLK